LAPRALWWPPDTPSVKPVEPGSPALSSSSEPAASDFDALVSVFAQYSKQLQSASAAVIAVQSATESLTAALLALSTSIAPLVAQNADTVPLLVASKALTTSLAPAFCAALSATVGAPLAAMVDSHRELAQRIAQRQAAAREHADASREFSALLAKRGAAVAPGSGATAALSKLSSTLGLSVPAAGERPRGRKGTSRGPSVRVSAEARCQQQCNS
jgi:hypothetical protein